MTWIDPDKLATKQEYINDCERMKRVCPPMAESLDAYIAYAKQLTDRYMFYYTSGK